MEIDPDLEAKLRQAISQSETDEELRTALEGLLGGGIRFQMLGSGQQGDSAWTLIIYPGTDPDAAARSVYLDLDKVFAALPDDGQYSSGFAMVEMENGYAILVRATVDRAGTEDKPDPVTLKSIAVTTNPKLEYWVGEPFDPTGMVITATYSNNTTKTITDITASDKKGVSWTPDGALTTVGTQDITISYGDQTTTVNVEVNKPEVEKIEVTTDPSKIEYQINDDFIPTGMVITATYSDNVKTETIDSDYKIKGVTWEPETIEADTEKVTIKYQNQTDTVDINVILPTLNNIQVTWSDRATYYVDEIIKKSEVVKSVTADYSYGNDPTLKSDEYKLTIKGPGDNAASTEITSDKPYKFDTAGEYTLTVTYDKYHKEKTIKVENKGYTVSEDGKTYSVSNAHGLQTWNEAALNDLSISCTLTADITLPTVSEGESNWTPIGTGSDNAYTGTFDGNGHTITGLTIYNHPSNYDNFVGLIGYLGGGGTVQNLSLENVNITGGDIVGSVVGDNYGTVTACTASGNVSGNSRIGGVVGWNNGTVSGGSYVGGVVGRNVSGTVTACYHANGTVSGDSYVGGMVGFNKSGTLTACYWSGYAGDGIGQDNTGKYSDGNEYFGERENMVNGNWTEAVTAMNTALGSGGWQYELTAGNPLPTLTNQ